MASAAPQKRMVSSVFITLASPYRATVTQQQHARKTHEAPVRVDPGAGQHAAVRVDPGAGQHAAVRVDSGAGDMQSVRQRKDSSSSEPRGGGQRTAAAAQAPPSDTPPTRLPDPVPVPDSSWVNTQQKKATPNESPEELFPPPPLWSSNSPRKAVPPQPAPASEEPSTTRLPASAPLSNKQDCITETERITPSSGEDSNTASPGLQSSPEYLNVESKEVCGFCRKPVSLSEPAIDALNRTYHDGCFQCRQCHVPLAGKQYYNKAGIPLCEDCYQASLELCWACGEVIKDHVIRALERTYHPPCFVCATCCQPIGEQRFAQGEVGEVYCLQDYYRKYAPQCSACQQLIIPKEDGTDSFTVECLGRSFHEDCYRCEVCVIQLSPEPNDQGCHPLDGRVLCRSCHLTLVQSAQL